MPRGTVKPFAYLLLLHNPNPHSLLAVTGPEEHLYPSLLGELVAGFRAYAHRRGQTLIASYAPEFLRGTKLDEVVWLVKANVFSEVRRANYSGRETSRGELNVRQISSTDGTTVTSIVPSASPHTPLPDQKQPICLHHFGMCRVVGLAPI